MRLLRHAREYLDGGRVGPLLCLEELSTEEGDYVRARFVDRLEDLRADEIGIVEIRRAYVSVLSEHGVACPHPELSVFFRRGHRYCELCGCPVILPR